MGSMRFTAWAMLVSTIFVLAHFALTRDLAVRYQHRATAIVPVTPFTPASV